MNYLSSLLVNNTFKTIIHSYISITKLYELKDQRYKAIKSLIENDNLKGIKEIFTIIPITIVRTDLKVNYNTLRSKISNPQLFTIKDVVSLSSLFEVPPDKVFNLILLDGTKSIKAKNKNQSK